MKPSVKQTSSSPSHCRYQQRLPEESDMRTFSRGPREAFREISSMIINQARNTYILVTKARVSCTNAGIKPNASRAD